MPGTSPPPDLSLDDPPIPTGAGPNGQLQTALDDHVIVAVTDRHGRITYANGGFCRISQYSRTELLRQDHRIISPAHHSKEFIRHFWESIANGRVWQGELKHRAKDGTPFWLDTTMVPSPDQLGQPGQFIAIQHDITGRKLAELELRNSEHELRSIVENLSEGVAVSDLTGRLLHFNRAALDMHGFASLADCLRQLPEFATTFLLARTDGAVLTLDQWPLARILRGEKLQNLEVVIRHLQQDWTRIFSYGGALVCDGSNRPQMAVVTISDITQRKRAETELHQSREEFRELFDRAPIGYHEVDAEGRIVRVNEAELKMLGYTQEELLGQSVWLISAEEEVSRHSVLAKLRGEPRPLVFERRLRRKDGTDFPAHIEDRLVRRKDGSIAGIRAGIIDLTGRKQAEAATARLAAIVSSSQDAIIGVDLAGTVTSWNGGAESIFGLTAGEMVGAPIQRLIPEDRKDEEDQIMRRIRAGLGVDNFETIRKTKEGRLIDVSVTDSPIRDADGRLVGVSKVVRDVTERKRAREEIRRLNLELEQRVVERTAQLEAANRELEAFSYTVSHDLRAPLRALDGFSQVVLEEYGSQLPGEGRRYLETIRFSAQRMGRLMDDLLQYARLSREELKARETDTAALVQSAIEELGAPWPDRQVELIPGALPVSRGDPVLLRQVWLNLLSNALKYTGKRERAVIEYGATRDGARTVFFVRDNGAGFDPRHADQLFGVFQRLHRTEDYAGTGVGLAIVDRIVRRHGGRVWAEAAVDRGATFFFTLE